MNLEFISKDFLNDNMMGPNCIRVLEEVLDAVPLKKGMRILDLGCGNGLTSLYLAKKYDVFIYAVDLWVSPTENLERFKCNDIDDRITPLYGDALRLPFAKGFFDAVISVDSYHYFANNDYYFHEKLLPFLKKDALVCLAFPGRKMLEQETVPPEILEFWEGDTYDMIHSLKWWSEKFSPYLNDFKAFELSCFEKAWEDWLCCDNPYAVSDRDMIKVDDGRFMNLLGFTGRVRN